MGSVDRSAFIVGLRLIYILPLKAREINFITFKDTFRGDVG